MAGRAGGRGRGGGPRGREAAGGAAEVVDPASQTPGQGLRDGGQGPPAGEKGSEWTPLHVWEELSALQRDALGL